nr:reverse transcriptase, RNA-dependent DNA polymerase [Tanacetum cinerariifolium]
EELEGNGEIVDIILKDLWQKAYNESEVVKEVIRISSSDEDLSSDEEMMLMGDIPFSNTDEEQPQVASTSRRYRKISMTECVPFLRARDTPTPGDQYVKKPIKIHVKLTNYVLGLRVVNAPDVDVGFSITKKKSRDIWNSLEEKYIDKKEEADKFIIFKFFEFAMEDKRKGTWNSFKYNKKDKKPLSKVVCYKCGDKWHVKRYYKNPKKKNQDSNKKDEYANVMEQVDTTEITAMYDSRATTHICNNKDLFKTYEEAKDEHEVIIELDSNVIVESRDVDFFKNKFHHDSTRTNENVTQIPQVISSPYLNSFNKRNMAESSHALKRSERTRKERNLDLDFIDSQALIFLVKGDNKNNVINIIPVILNVEDAPKTYKEVITSKNSSFWMVAIDDKIDSLISNNTWELSDLSSGSKTIGCRLVFRIKYHTYGSIQTFKARLVIQGFSQRQ